MRHTLALLAFCLTLPITAQVYQPTTCRNAFSPQQEIAEGDKVAAEVYKQMPVLPDNDPVSRYIQQLGARLASAAPATPGLEQRWPFRFHVVASEDINAFALPGGTMFVNLGAIRAAETEAQLAGVMGHEMSHVILRHSTCKLSQEQRKSVWYGLGAIGSAILLGDSTAGNLARAGIGLGQSLDFLHMSRTDEQQADLLGVQITHNAGFDPRGLPQFFEIIQAKYGSGGAQFLSDHPNPGNRTQYVNAEIAQLSPLPNPIKTSQAFAAAHARSIEQRVYSSEQMKSGQWRSTGLYASRPGGTAEVVETAPPSGSATPHAVPPAVSPIPLSRLGLRDPLASVQMPRYRVRVPASWRASDQKQDAVTLAPPGGAGEFGVAYGALFGVLTFEGDGVQDADDLGRATRNMAERLLQSGGLTQASSVQSLQVGGQEAESVLFRGASPVGENGRALPERDWLVTMARPDGDIDYVVFVAPERDFNSLRPTFNAILSSIQPQ